MLNLTKKKNKIKRLDIELTPRCMIKLTREKNYLKGMKIMKKAKNKIISYQ